MVVSHDAFGYLAKYGLHLEPIAGLSPGAEPTPDDLGRLQTLIKDKGITTVFSETLASPKMSETLAGDLGIDDRRPRPARGSDRTGQRLRRGLPFHHARKPLGPGEGERVLTTVDPVEIRNVAVGIAGRPILRGIDLTVRTGQFVALMGSNGSGKSTLVRALTGLSPLTAGSISLFGTPIGSFHDWHRIGFVPQRASAATGVPASVREVIASGRLTRRRLLRPLSRADRQAIDDAIEVVGLTDLAQRGVSQLSGGQQQRVLIARALAGEPDLFFLDEPAAGVDLPNQHALADALRVLSDRGATIVLVAHELGPMASLIDRAVVMRDGRIAYDGGPLADHEVHHPDFGEAHAHHHHAPVERLDHAPHVGSPLDRGRS